MVRYRPPALLVLLLSGFLITPSSSYHKYTFFNVKKTWAEAQSYCRECFTDLATMENKSTVPQLQSVVPDGKAWIGLFSNMSKWSWSVNPKKDARFYNWDVMQPDYGEENVYCVTMRKSGKWGDENCFNAQPLLCYRKAAGGNMTYHLLKPKAAWGTGQAECTSNGMDGLAVITTPLQNDAAQKLVSEDTWIGLRWQRWVWSDGYDGDFYDNWGPNQPKPGSTHLCVAVHFPAVKWYTYKCNRKLPFICNEGGTKKTYLRMKLQSSADLTDPTINSLLLQQLHTALGNKGIENFRLRWSSPPARQEEEEDRN